MYGRYGLRQPGAALVVCPLSVLSTWCAELKRWCPSLRAIKLHAADTNERERLKAVISEQVGSYDVVVTTCAPRSPAALSLITRMPPAARACLLRARH